MVSRLKRLLFVVFLIIIGCKEAKIEAIVEKSPHQFSTPLGKEFIIQEPSGKMLDLYQKANKDFKDNPNNLDNIIWYGRRTAYLAQYEKAIAIYSEGIEKFPSESRLYRHRGHRYISIRMYNEAINDLERASQLIKGQENEMEADGIPNAMDIPVSSKHGNIWYHLGLAYYLIHDYENAFDAFLKCRESGNNDDNIVSSTHWLYMIQRRLGNLDLAHKMLTPISVDANIIENQSYQDLCKFYKGLIPMDSLINTEKGNPSSDAVLYGLANWHFYNGDKTKANEMMLEMMDNKSWSSFGYLAAESDIIEYFNGK